MTASTLAELYASPCPPISASPIPPAPYTAALYVAPASRRLQIPIDDPSARAERDHWADVKLFFFQGPICLGALAGLFFHSLAREHWLLAPFALLLAIASIAGGLYVSVTWVHRWYVMHRERSGACGFLMVFVGCPVFLSLFSPMVAGLTHLLAFVVYFASPTRFDDRIE